MSDFSQCRRGITNQHQIVVVRWPSGSDQVFPIRRSWVRFLQRYILGRLCRNLVGRHLAYQPSSAYEIPKPKFQRVVTNTLGPHYYFASFDTTVQGSLSLQLAAWLQLAVVCGHAWCRPHPQLGRRVKPGVSIFLLVFSIG